VDVKVEESLCASAAECQLHLLEHMEALHNQTSTRMDLIERELDGNTHSLTHSLTRVDMHAHILKEGNHMVLLCPPPSLSFSLFLSLCECFANISLSILVLESWLDHSGELEPPDPLSRLPEIKQRIRRLLGDLGTLRRLSAIH